jgi:hypothetical protein
MGTIHTTCRTCTKTINTTENLHCNECHRNRYEEVFARRVLYPANIELKRRIKEVLREGSTSTWTTPDKR